MEQVSPFGKGGLRGIFFRHVEPVMTAKMILLKNPHFLFLIDAKNAFDSNMKVARDKFSSTLVLTRENKLLLALKRGSESAFSSERRAD